MFTDKFGLVSITEDEAFEALYNKNISSLDKIYLDSHEVINQFKEANQKNLHFYAAPKLIEHLYTDISEFDKENQKNWFIPDAYKTFPIIEWIYSKCSSDLEKTRVAQELELFVQYNMLDLLIFLKYLVDTMREHNIVWGVGRGSSVASFVLYLIGVHKINSLKYNLDIGEFLK